MPVGADDGADADAAAAADEDAALALGHAELDALLRDADVAAGGDLEAAAHDGAGERGDDGDARVLELCGDGVPAAGVGLHLVGARDGRAR